MKYVKIPVIIIFFILGGFVQSQELSVQHIPLLVSIEKPEIWSPNAVQWCPDQTCLMYMDESESTESTLVVVDLSTGDSIAAMKSNPQSALFSNFLVSPDGTMVLMYAYESGFSV